MRRQLDARPEVAADTCDFVGVCGDYEVIEGLEGGDTPPHPFNEGSAGQEVERFVRKPFRFQPRRYNAENSSCLHRILCGKRLRYAIFTPL